MIAECLNSYCVYYKDKKCTLDKIYINAAGVCDECINVSVPEKEFEMYREKHLKRLNELDNEKWGKQ